MKNYKEKYLKYKQKYLQLKNQIGGKVTATVEYSKNSIKITGLPSGTTLNHLQDYLVSNGIIPTTNGYKMSNGDFLINFTDYAEAKKNYDNLGVLLVNYNPIINNTCIFKPHHHLVHQLPPPQFPQPWAEKSKLLFIALPIEQLSDIGREINSRIHKVLGRDVFNPGPLSDRLISPHISLLSLYIKTDSDVDSYLQHNLKTFIGLVKNEFISLFDNVPCIYNQLHSPRGDYKQLNNWIVRAYDDPKYLDNITRLFIKFKKNVTSLLFKLIKNIHVKDILVQTVKPHYSPIKELEFTHYYIEGNKYPNTQICISSFYENWIPHISLIKSNDFDNFTKEFKLAATSHQSAHMSSHQTPGKSMSFINLWRYSDRKEVQTLTRTLKLNGSFSHIHGAYNDTYVYTELDYKRCVRVN